MWGELVAAPVPQPLHHVSPWPTPPREGLKEAESWAILETLISLAGWVALFNMSWSLTSGP